MAGLLVEKQQQLRVIGTAQTQIKNRGFVRAACAHYNKHAEIWQATRKDFPVLIS